METITEPAFRTHLLAEIDELPYIVEADLVYASVILAGVVTVPIGFKTDLYSIPLGLWNILPREGKANAAAVIHDWLYQNGSFQGRSLDQRTCDRVLGEAMKCGGMPAWRRVLIVAGLRVGGFLAWNRYRRMRRVF